MNTIEEVKSYLVDRGYEETIVFENPDYAQAFIGVSYNGQAIYDYDKMVKSLVEQDDMTEEEAVEFIDYNCSFAQADYPIIMYPLEE